MKPGAGAGILVNTANSDIKNLTKNDVVIFCGDANDVANANVVAVCPDGIEYPYGQ